MSNPKPETTEALPPIVVRLPPDHPDGDRILWDWLLGKWVTLDGERRPSRLRGESNAE